MRRACLALCLLLCAVAVGAPLAAGAGPGDRVTVAGTVAGVDGAPAGDAVVLVGETGALTERPTAALREAAAGDPADLAVVPVGDGGRFRATVAWDRAEAAVAVSDRGVSALASVGRENATLSLRLAERRPQTVHAHLGGVAHGERRATLYLSLDNNGAAPVENLSVALAAVPDGWTVTNVTGAGRYDPSARTVAWPSVAPGGAVRATVVLAVPAGTAPGEYPVALRAASAGHRVAVDRPRETATVLPEETAGPTTAPPPGDATDATDLPPRTPAATPAPTDADGPGFGAAAGAAALALLAVLAVRAARRR